MEKWYEDISLDNEIIISSRIRLARNLKNYPFSPQLSDEDAKEIIEKAKSVILNDRTCLNQIFDFIDLNKKSYIDKLSMIETHIISPVLMNKKTSTGVLLQNDEHISILLNEEDHIRIQAIYSGNNIDAAYEACNRIDDLFEETLEYCYDTKYGYLTSCLTNLGTGLRASFMLHLPMLEANNRIPLISQSINKFGMTIRGIYGEGSEPMGSIYQISNQITLGKSEREIIESLKTITNQIIEQEKSLRLSLISKKENEISDEIYRSYGILKYCKKISADEAMELLSNIRLGLTSGILKIDKPELNIYNIMINIKSGNIQKKVSSNSIDEERAKYLNKILGSV